MTTQITPFPPRHEGEFQPSSIMKHPFVLVTLCMYALCGCSRKAATRDATAPQPTPEQAAQIESEYLLPTNDTASAAAASAIAADPSPGQRAPKAQPTATTIQERINGAVHAQLTMQLRMFIEKNGRVPGSFSEFASAAMDSPPPAPDGMKFVIDPTDRTVKAVKK